MMMHTCNVFGRVGEGVLVVGLRAGPERLLLLDRVFKGQARPVGILLEFLFRRFCFPRNIKSMSNKGNSFLGQFPKFGIGVREKEYTKRFVLCSSSQTWKFFFNDYIISRTRFRLHAINNCKMFSVKEHERCKRRIS